MTVISIPAVSDVNTILYERGWKRYYAESPSDYLSLKSFSNGAAHYTVGSSRFLVHARVYLLLNHGQPYTIEIDSDQDIESFCLFFAPGFADSIQHSVVTADDQLLTNPYNSPPTSLNVFERTYPYDDNLSSSIVSLKQATIHKPMTRGWFEESLHRIMLCLLQSQTNIYREIEKLPAARPATREELYRRLHLARDYAEAIFTTPVTLEDMAQVACLSPNHLLRTFKHLFGQTPHQYRIGKKLDYACQLLEESNFSVTEICMTIGFESLGTFITLFHRRFGVTPTQYRQQNR